MKSDFETQWEREFERSMSQKPPNPASCATSCFFAVLMLWMLGFFTFWILIELAERLQP